MQLRGRQEPLVNGVCASHAAGNRNVLGQGPTGIGKTVMMNYLNALYQRPTINIAHRSELVNQIALAAARFKLQHRIIAPKAVINFCKDRQRAKLGYTTYNPDAALAVSSVDTLLRRTKTQADFLDRVRLWQMDEAHHVLKDNKWGKAVALFPEAHGVGWTATPRRADGYGLGAHNDGVFHDMILGPTTYQSIEEGFLTPFDYRCPPDCIPTAELTVGATGDFTQNSLIGATREHLNEIVGDVVGHYCKFAMGKRGVTFVPDAETAKDIASAFRAAGVPAEAVSHHTKPTLREKFIDQLEKGELLQLVNVDLFGEGFDLPAIEVVSMARKTKSLGLYLQQAGRASRLQDGKTHGLILDHVGNLTIHGPPDADRLWSLEATRGRRKKGEEDIEVTTCLNPECYRVYEAFRTACPYCSAEKVPADRTTPEAVDGDLIQLTPEMMQRLREEVYKADLSVSMVVENSQQAGMPDVAVRGRASRHLKMQEAQKELRRAMEWFGGLQQHIGLNQREAQKKFYLKFGVDILTAQTLGEKEAYILRDKIYEEFVK